MFHSLPLCSFTYFLISFVVFFLNLLFFIFSFPITCFFLLLPFVLFLFNLFCFCYSSSFMSSTYIFFFYLFFYLFSLNTFFGKDPMILLLSLVFFLSSFLFLFFLFFSMLLFSVFCQFFSFFYTTPVPFCSVLKFSFLCSFLSLLLLLFYISFAVFVSVHLIFLFCCISFPFALFCCSNFFLFSLLFLYSVTIFPSPFHFHPLNFIYHLLPGIPLCALWCLLLFKRDMLYLIHFFCSCIFCSTYVILIFMTL